MEPYGSLLRLVLRKKYFIAIDRSMLDAIKCKLVAISNKSLSNSMFKRNNIFLYSGPNGFRSYLNKMMFLLEVR